MMRISFALAVLLLVSTCLVATAHAAATKSQLTMLINDRGSVEVVDRWSGLAQEAGTYKYFSAAREVGEVPVSVKDYGFTLAFKTRSYLRYEDGYYYFATRDLYYEGGPLDVELSLTYPPNLKLLESTPPPSYQGDGVLHWSLPDCQHQVVIARFERTGPFVQPGRSGPDYQVNPSTLLRLNASELPQSADETLKELENIIKMARASKTVDPDFAHVLEKLLAKLYYIMDYNGLLLDYKLPKKEPDKQPEGKT